MPIDETDSIAIQQNDATVPGPDNVSVGQVLTPGRVTRASLADLRIILGIPAAPQNQIDQGVGILAFTDGTNVAASVAGNARHIRVGNVVFVSGEGTVSVTAGAPTTTVLNIAIPIASTFGATSDLTGIIIGGSDDVDQGIIIGDTGTDDAEAIWEASAITNLIYHYSYSYTII